MEGREERLTLLLGLTVLLLPLRRLAIACLKSKSQLRRARRSEEEEETHPAEAVGHIAAVPGELRTVPAGAVAHTGEQRQGEHRIGRLFGRKAGGSAHVTSMQGQAVAESRD